ncbi:MAG TPA: hypothetical protein PLS53_01690 [Thermoanaerobaculaceae bacterium]|nr:hypothetical protein [Thermoanaerobaculaceae bacterium]HPS76848.1 hypothetical protein [Thermoanaerobaculaceae bacterium]
MITGAFERARQAYFKPLGRRELERQAADADARELGESQWWSNGRLRAYQAERLARLLDHAGRHTAWYGRHFSELGRGGGGDPWETLASFPVLHKRDLQVSGVELVADNAAALGAFHNQTGGSTGERVQLKQSRRYHDRAMRQIERGFAWCGFQPGDSHVFVWGSDVDSREHAGAVAAWRDFWHWHRLWVNTFDLSWSSLAGVVARLRLLRPRFLFGYVSSLAMVAHAIEALGETAVCPIAVETTAELLSPDHRRHLERVLGCEVFDRYGCREVGNIAHECGAHAGLHSLAESNLVEVLELGADRPAAPGELGRIVVTNLDNWAQPMLRYEVGDLGRLLPGACPCGRGLPRLRVEAGRLGDVLEGPSGRLLHSEFFTHLFYGHPGVWQFEVVQDGADHLRVRVVPGPGYDDRVRHTVTEQILTNGDPAFRVTWEVVEGIAPAKSGKYRFVRREP